MTPQDAEVSAGRGDRPDALGGARERAPTSAGEQLEDGCPGLGRALVAVSSELVGVCERALEMTVEYVKDRKQFGVPGGRLPGGLAPLRADAAGHREGALDDGVRGVERGREPRRRWRRRRRWPRPRRRTRAAR